MPLRDTMSERSSGSSGQGFEHARLDGRRRRRAGARGPRPSTMCGCKAGLRDFGLEPLGGGFRRINIEKLAALGAQGLAHGVKAVKKREAAARTPEDRPLRMACPLRCLAGVD